MKEFPFLFNGAYIQKYDQVKEGFILKNKDGHYLRKKYSFFDKVSLFFEKGKVEQIVYRYIHFFKDYDSQENKVTYNQTYEQDFNKVLQNASCIPEQDECFQVDFRNELISFKNKLGDEYYLRFGNNGYKMEMLTEDIISKEEKVIYFDYFLFPQNFFK